MKALLSCLSLSLVLGSAPLSANETLPFEPNSSDYIRERIYLRADLGFSFPSNKDLQNIGYPEPDIAGTVGMGAYLSLNDYFMLGASLDSTAEVYEATFFDGSKTEITHSIGQLSLSSMYFPGKRLGEGFFLRADFGKPELTVSSERSNRTTEVELSSSYQPLFGLGMTIPVSSESRWIFSLMYYSNEFELDGITFFEKEGLKLTVGGLW